MQKWIVFSYALIFWAATIFTQANEAKCAISHPAEKLMQSQLQQLPTGELENFWQQFKTQYGAYLGDNGHIGLMDMLLAKGTRFSLSELGLGILKFFLHEVLLNAKLLGTIIVLAVFSMFLQILQTAFESNAISRVAYAVVFMVILILAVDSFQLAIAAAKGAISRMIDFMLALTPLLLTLLTTMGHVVSVTIFHPLLISLVHIISTIIYTLIFPLLFLATILSLVSSISDKYKVNQLADLMRKLSMTILGGLLAIFLGVISIQGTTAAVTDGVTLRTAKYLTGNFIPIIGRTISEAADTVMGASLLVKNTLGLAGVFILLLVCVFPAAKILSLAFVYKISAAVLQPLGNSPVVDSLATIGQSFVYVFAALALVGLMLFLSLAVIIAAGNMAVMMR